MEPHKPATLVATLARAPEAHGGADNPLFDRASTGLYPARDSLQRDSLQDVRRAAAEATSEPPQS
jgi:hypothetical protein